MTQTDTALEMLNILLSLHGQVDDRYAAEKQEIRKLIVGYCRVRLQGQPKLSAVQEKILETRNAEQ